MRSILTKIGLLLLAVTTAVVVSGCEEALTDSNTEGIPNTAGTDTTSGTAFIEIVSGSRSNPLVGTASRADGVDLIDQLVGDDTVSVEVEPNFAVQDDIIFEYSLSGSAESGDYRIPNPSPDTITYEQGTTEIDDAFIDVIGRNPEGGVELTNETREVTITLESARTAGDGGREVLVGRGGSEVGVSRTVEIGPSVSLSTPGGTFVQSVAFDTTSTAPDSSSVQQYILFNLSSENFTGSNYSISGSDADAFNVQPPAVLTFEPGATTGILALSFAPSSAGEKGATFSFEVSNSSNSATIEIPLSGVAQDPGS